MLVVAIVSLLAAIVTPKFANMVDKAREAGMKANLAVLRSGLSLYYADNEGLYPKYDALTAAVNRGMVLLHPKYVDFNEITFIAPRYAGGNRRKAMDIYCCDVVTIQSHNSRATVPPDNPPVHSASVFPSYWNHLLNQVPARASIKTHAFNMVTMSPYVDTNGQAWSLW
jgi:Tfp pilus assembly protein PilE